MKAKKADLDILPPVPPEMVAAFYALGDRLNEGGEPFEMVKWIYEFTDHFLATCVSPASCCASGCSDCCRILVEITELEAAYISKNTMFNHIPNPQPAVRAADIWPPALHRCPFNNPETGKCGIYSVRPIACRVYHVFDDKKFCWPPDQKHIIYTMNSDPAENPIMARVCGALLEINTKMGLKWADIRDYFK